jgi:hypothetical protein
MGSEHMLMFGFQSPKRRMAMTKIKALGLGLVLLAIVFVGVISRDAYACNGCLDNLGDCYANGSTWCTADTTSCRLGCPHGQNCPVYQCVCTPAGCGWQPYAENCC